jgi:glycerol dehydrogenase
MMTKDDREIPVFFNKLRANTRGYCGPWNYIQGPGEFDKIEKYTSKYSKNVFILIDSLMYDLLGARLKQAYEQTDSTYRIDKFNGECCCTEITRVATEIKRCGATLAVAVGGGKTLDTLKAAAVDSGIHYFIVPTSAANDAPVSSFAIIYTDEGHHDGGRTFDTGSTMVLVDSEIIAKAPRRFIISGMGDALSTYFEARAVERSNTQNLVGEGYRCCKVGLAIAKLSYEILLADGVKALQALDRGIISEAVENIIEANTLMSGLGFQNTNCSIAHAVNAGLAEIPGAVSYLHGERVAFGVLCQLMFENSPMEEINTVLKFMVDVGLPVTLKQVGVEPVMDSIMKIADKMVYRNRTSHTQVGVINIDTIAASIMAADAMGAAFLTKSKC